VIGSSVTVWHMSAVVTDRILDLYRSIAALLFVSSHDKRV
jgi:hypothetical protein